MSENMHRIMLVPRSHGVVGVVAVVLYSSARHRRVVVVGVLLGVGHCSPARRNVASILKIAREKKNYQWDQDSEVTSPGPGWLS